MTTPLDEPMRHGKVERHGSAGTIRFERVLAHPVDRVWDAVTTPGGLSDWWLPFPAQISIELVIGGTMSFSAPEFGPEAATCQILELDPPTRLVHTHFDPTITLTWELEPAGDGCRLRLTQHMPDLDAALGQDQVVGLHHSLERLEPSLEGRPQPWDWDQLSTLRQEYAQHMTVRPPP